MPVCLGRGRN
ncbi:hypothetical protein F383_28569 [Gossypium arboreum]|uniref:Uncharacterized protein n=1 Tax=Gossypium arboreum TaxID=29729 RepID=A0A0B0P832_GOSAR|nr:hypothetical protein F383_28569 [Gossypium arboreum]